jgi:hypothetical protein
MQLPENYIDKIKKREAGEPRSSRDVVLEDFLKRINPGREAAGYAPYTTTRIAGMISRAGYKTGDLHALYEECSKGRSFGALFETIIKSKV